MVKQLRSKVLSIYYLGFLSILFNCKFLNGLVLNLGHDEQMTYRIPENLLISSANLVQVNMTSLQHTTDPVSPNHLM